jgi:hypothetical protein
MSGGEGVAGAMPRAAMMWAVLALETTNAATCTTPYDRLRTERCL